MSRGNQRKPFVLPQIDQKQQQQQQKPILISQPPEQTDNYNFITATKKKTVQIKETPPDNYDSTLVDELRRKCEEYKKDIEARNSTIFSIQRNFESLSGLLKTEKSENQQIREDFKRLKEENISFLLQAKKLQEELSGLKDQYSQQEKEVMELQDERKALKKQASEVNSLRLRCDELEKILNSKTSELQSLYAKQKELVLQIQRNKNAETDKELLGEKIKFLAQQIEESESQMLMKQVEIDSLQKQCSSLKQLLEKEKEEGRQVQRLLQQARSYEQVDRIEGISQKGSASQLQEFQEQIERQKGLIKQLQDEQECRKTQLQLSNSVESQIKSDIQGLQQQLKQKTQELDEKNSEISRINTILGEYKAFDDFIKQLEKNLVISRKIKALNSSNICDVEVIDSFELNALKKQLGSFQASNELLSRSLKDKERECSEMNSLQRRFGELKDELYQKNQAILQFTGTVGEVSAQASSLEEKNRQFQQIILSLKKDNQEWKSRGDEYERVLDTLRSNLKQFELKCEEKERSIEALQRKLSKYQAENKKTFDALDEKESEVNSLKLRLQSQIESTEQLNGQLRLQLEQCKQQEQLSKTDKLRFEGELQTQRTQIEELTRSLQDMEDQNNRLQAHIAEEEQNRKLQEQELQSKNQSQDQISSELSTLRAKRTQLEDLMKILRGDLKSREDAVTSLTAELKSAKQQIAEETNSRKQLEEQLRTSKISFKDKDDELYQTKLENKQLKNQLATVREEMDRLNPEKARKLMKELEEKNQEFLNMLQKIEHAETNKDSTITGITCSSCMEVLASTITCIPCGHSYCQKCTSGYQPECAECGATDGNYRNKQLDDLISKIRYAKVTVQNLKEKYRVPS